MTYLYYLVIGLVTVIWHTAIQPQIDLLTWLYDLFIPMTIYLGLYRSGREGVPVVFCIGFAMDNLSAAPFGLFITSYIWIFAGIKWLMTFLDVRGSLLLFFITGCGVILQNVLFLAAAAVMGSGPVSGELIVRGLFVQFLWALITGPAVIAGIHWGHQWVEKWWAERMADKNGYYIGD